MLTNIIIRHIEKFLGKKKTHSPLAKSQHQGQRLAIHGGRRTGGRPLPLQLDSNGNLKVTT